MAATFTICGFYYHRFAGISSTGAPMLEIKSQRQLLTELVIELIAWDPSAHALKPYLARLLGRDVAHERARAAHGADGHQIHADDHAAHRQRLDGHLQPPACRPPRSSLTTWLMY